MSLLTKTELAGLKPAHFLWEVQDRIGGFGMGQREVKRLVGRPGRLLELDVEAAHAGQQPAFGQVVPQRLDVPLGADAAGRVEHVGDDRLVARVEHRGDGAPGGAHRPLHVRGAQSLHGPVSARPRRGSW